GRANWHQYKELRAKSARTAGKLPENCAKIFGMNRSDGETYSEIAEKLPISIKTLEANMGRARRECRRALSECKQRSEGRQIGTPAIATTCGRALVTPGRCWWPVSGRARPPPARARSRQRPRRCATGCGPRRPR